MLTLRHLKSLKKCAHTIVPKERDEYGTVKKIGA
jgi:hypothetical protein